MKNEGEKTKASEINPESWRRVKAIFLEVLEQSETERAGFLLKACGGDLEIKKEVEDLLAAHFESESFIENPAFEVASIFKSNGQHQRTEKRFGHYKIIKEIGIGGMGAVFLAERDDGQFRQEVAVKIIRQTLADSEIINRFKRERQILASLNHPNIAKLLDGGVTADGLPFLAMEYVAGEPITEFAEKNCLNIEERLELFLKICSGVAHAHRNLIVHRDLKPSNIFVADDGNPKLLDFGLAKLLDNNLDAGSTAAAATATAFRAMTPAYASPEQLRGETITTASDIYSLGVVLYELLTGVRPFQFKNQSLDEAIKVVCGTDPTRPSEAAAAAAASKSQKGKKETGKVNSSGTFVSESFPPPGSRSSLKGDLDNIVLKSLRKEPVRRYLSVEQFAADIDRYLKGLPVSARPNTFSYRAEKFIKRNKIGVTAALLVLLSLLGGIFATAWQAKAAARERDKAIISQAKAERINAFLQDMLKSASPEENGKDAKVIDVLNDASQRIETEFNDQPEQKIEILLTLVGTYQNLGLFELATQKARRALDLSVQNFGERSKLTAHSESALGEILVITGNNNEAERLLRDSLDIQQKLSLMGTKEYTAAEYTLGELLLRKGDLSAAETFLNNSLASGKEVFGENSLEVAMCEISLGRLREFSGDLNAAEISYRKTADFFRQTPRYRSRLILSLINLGHILITKEKYDDADLTLREADEISGAVFGNVDYMRGIILNYRSQIQFIKGDFAKTVELAQKSVNLLEPLMNKEDVNLLNAKTRFGAALVRTDKAVEGEKILRQVSETLKTRQNNEPWRIPLTELRLGESLVAQNKLQEAEPLILNGLEGIKNSVGDKHLYMQEALKIAVALYGKLNKPELVAKYRALQTPNTP